MSTGSVIRAARERAGLTQEELANEVGVTLRTVGNWERGATVPLNRMAAVKAALETYWQDDATPDQPAPLREVADVELLAEIARRFARGREDGGGSGTDRAASMNVTSVVTESTRPPGPPPAE